MEISLGQLELALLRAKLAVFEADLAERLGRSAPALVPVNHGMFLQLARQLHPDLESDPVRRTFRETLMVEVNLANEDGDGARLEAIRDAISGDRDAAGEMARLARTPLAQLRDRVKYAARHQRDLIVELQEKGTDPFFQAVEKGVRPLFALGEVSVREEFDIDAPRRVLTQARAPFGKSVILRLSKSAQSLEALDALDPEDLNGLIDEWPDFVNLTNEQVRPLARFLRLEELRMGRTAIDGHVFDGFPPLKELRWLALDETAFDDHGMEHLAASAWMQRLDLSSTKITGQGLWALHLMASLRELNLYGTKIGDNDLIVLNSLPTLRILNCGLTNLTDEVARRIGRLQCLEVLHLGGTAIGDGTLEHLAELPLLRDLTLWETKITDAGMERLQEFPALRYLDVDDTGVTRGAMQRFHAARPEVKLPSDIWQAEAHA